MDLSVIIPVCNAQKHIAACLRSVTRCPKRTIDMECIVVNDAEADETAAVVNRYIERDSRIKLVAREDGEVSDARNRGVEAALGKYIMFLDADDRLCEDAWEQLEAAVEEEYADFVAFSHITLNKNGKFKAQMLPISDVISTDDLEARRLMYAEPVLNTCWGKLFKGRIIRDNNIIFRTAPPVGGDFLFVAEYFWHCESYLMTKAMILYCPQKENGITQSYSIEERIDFVRTLYEFHADVVKRYNDNGLTGCIPVYYFNVLTDLFGEYAKAYRQDRAVLESCYKKALEHEFARRVFDEVDESALRSGRKRHEYRLLKGQNTAKIRRYFALRSR